MDYCRMFMSGMSIKSIENDLEIFTFLIPTEKLFEDFLFGFIRDEFSNEKRIENIISQGSGLKNKFLAKSFKFNVKPKDAFGLKPDIYIQKETGSDDLILDSKYKVLYTKDEAEEFDRKETGVGIGDVYQMLAYTVKLDVKTCHLLYPPSMDSKDSLSGYYEIDNHNGFVVSTVYYHRLPTMLSNSDVDLKELISYQEDLLRNELKKIICD
jgi:5-methylcytosine-specific restriction enzyme subunit McrC